MYGLQKQFTEAETECEIGVRMLEKAYPMIRRATEAYMAIFQSDKEKLRRILPILEAHPDETFLDGTTIASFHFSLGDFDKGFDWLERSFESKDQSLLLIRVNPFFTDAVRADPRYLAFLKKTALE
jgi:hypothetical protein